MTKKDYEKVTNAINTTLRLAETREQLETLSQLKGALIAEFERSEPRFDRYKFMYAMAIETARASQRINESIDKKLAND